MALNHTYLPFSGRTLYYVVDRQLSKLPMDPLVLVGPAHSLVAGRLTLNKVLRRLNGQTRL